MTAKERNTVMYSDTLPIRSWLYRLLDREMIEKKIDLQVNFATDETPNISNIKKEGFILLHNPRIFWLC